jgi:hypothetical protein
VQVDKVQLDDFAVEITFDTNDKYYSLFGSGILSWQSGSNTVQFVSATVLSPGDRVLTSAGTGLLINDINVVYDTGSYYSFDVEESDTILLKPNSIIVHNYECFAAGTQILLEDGTTKNIEDVRTGDVVKSFNFNTNEIENKLVGNTLSILSDHIALVKFEDGNVLKVTKDHPIWTNNGWSALDVELTMEKYQIGVAQLNVGDIVKRFDDEVKIDSIQIIEEPTMTFTLKGVEDNANFFAEGVLVHNRPMIGVCFVAGTKITMFDSTVKNIEDVVVGDSVLSFNEVTKETEIQNVVMLKQPIHNDLVKYTLSNGETLTSTFDHPHYISTIDGLILASYKPELTMERYDLGRTIHQIKVGDGVQTIDYMSHHIVSIEELPVEDTQTYIFTVENNHNFYANGILTHNK